MALATTDRFGGLDLRDDPQEAGASAIDGVNFDLDQSGRVRSRDGYAKLSQTAAASSLSAIGYSRNLQTIVAVAGSTGVAYAWDGTFLAASAALTTGVSSVVPFGSPTVSYVYLPKGTSDTTIARWDGTTWTYPATGYSAYLAAVQTGDNRLVLANFIGGGGFPSHVRFSDAGLPETFSANNFVILTPGDGEVITAMCAWGNLLFVFKETKFFVFYGNSTDGTGQPVFNYRTINSGVGVNGAGFGRGVGAVAGPDGVYFFAGDGIYRTTGGNPVKVSRALDPFFGGTPHPLLSDQIVLVGSTVFLASVEKRVYFTCLTLAGARRMFVLDTETGQWTIWNVNATGVSYRLTTAVGRPEVIFSYASGTNDIGTFTPGLTTDDTQPIASRYRTGFLDLGDPDTEKHVRGLLLDGTGTVTVKTAVNDATDLSTGANIALGTAPAVAQGRDGRAFRGRNASIEISSNSPWSLSRLSANVLAQRAPGLRSAA